MGRGVSCRLRLAYKRPTCATTGDCAWQKRPRVEAVEIGSSTWARTRDLRINSPSLYRLSYRGRRWALIICDACLLQDSCDGFRDVVNIAAVECSDANAPRVNRVDVKLFPQPIDMLCCQPAVGKHSVLT